VLFVPALVVFAHQTRGVAGMQLLFAWQLAKKAGLR
jgi:hypothetical protein